MEGSGMHGSTDTDGANERLQRSVALAQAVFYALTGIWSLVGIRSFQKVTGPKSGMSGSSRRSACS